MTSSGSAAVGGIALALQHGQPAAMVTACGLWGAGGVGDGDDGDFRASLRAAQHGFGAIEV